MRRPLRLAAWAAAAASLACAGRPPGMRPITPPAPEFPIGAAWFHSEPLTFERLKGRRVTLVAFLNVSSLNSIRTFGALKTWWDRYSQDGLMIVGVHGPDFDSDRDQHRVRAHLRKFGIKFPIVLDNDRSIWKGYQNEGWPAYYLVDHRGRIIYDRLGEGGARELETEIRGALERMSGWVAPPSMEVLSNPPNSQCGKSTPLRYVGSERGKQRSLEGVQETQRALVANRDGEIGYRGKWALEPEALRLTRDNPALNDYIRLIYRGAEVVAFLESANRRPIKVFLRQDDLWLHANNAGADVQWDESDQSFVMVSEPRLYYLAKNDRNVMHELTVSPQETGAAVKGFDFSNACQTDYEHK